MDPESPCGLITLITVQYSTVLSCPPARGGGILPSWRDLRLVPWIQAPFLHAPSDRAGFCGPVCGIGFWSGRDLGRSSKQISVVVGTEIPTGLARLWSQPARPALNLQCGGAVLADGGPAGLQWEWGRVAESRDAPLRKKSRVARLLVLPQAATCRSAEISESTTRADPVLSPWHSEQAPLRMAPADCGGCRLWRKVDAKWTCPHDYYSTM